MGKGKETSQRGRRLEGLQVMRAIAALLVVVHHSMEVSRASPTEPICPDWLTTAGAGGVDIFFVISGFIMMVVSFPNGRTPDDPWSFLRRRIARIYPLYWIAAAIVLVGWQLGFYNTFASLNPTAADIIRSLLLIPASPLIVGVSWTLVHEMNFYVLFALMLFARSPIASVLGVMGLLLLQMIVAVHVPDAAFQLFFTRPILLEFCFGLVLGYAHLKGMLPERIPWVFPAVAFAFMIFAPLFIAHEGTGGLDAGDRVWAWGIPAVVLVAACLSWSVGQGPAGKTWVLLGDASYAIYLLHPFILVAYTKALLASSAVLNAPQIPFIIAATILSAAVGTAVHVLVERPASKAARRLLLLDRTDGRAATAPAS